MVRSRLSPAKIMFKLQLESEFVRIHENVMYAEKSEHPLAEDLCLDVLIDSEM